MRISLINPLQRGGARTLPPIMLGYVANSLRESKHEPSITDLNIGDTLNFKSDLYVVSTSNLDYYNCPLLDIKPVLSVLWELVKAKKQLIVMGPHATTLPEFFTKHSDYVVVGEPEYAITELVNALDRKGDLSKVKGIVFRNGKKIVKTGLREPIKDLDKLPFPARDLIKHYKYKNPAAKRKTYTPLLSSRGCPFNCIFCYKDMFKDKWRKRSAGNVLKEMGEIKEKYKISDIWIRDELFTLDKKRVLDICKGIKEQGLGIDWTCGSRTDCVDRNMLEKMHDSGCYMISFGIESGSQRVLDTIKKGTKVEDIKKVVKWCHETGIMVRGYFIIGAPGEAEKDMNQTSELAKELDLDYFMLSVMTPYPKTELYDWGVREHVIEQEKDLWENPLKYAGKIGTPYNLEQLQNKKMNMYLDYYMRFGYIAGRIKRGRIKPLMHGFVPFVKRLKSRRFRGKE